MIVINLKEAGRKEELGNGSLCMKIQKKMTSTMLANYNRWVFEQKKVECVETKHTVLARRGSDAAILNTP